MGKLGWRVAPHMGAWIEIRPARPMVMALIVAPRMGAWIEITSRKPVNRFDMSHPTWMHGLKLS